MDSKSIRLKRQKKSWSFLLSRVSYAIAYVNSAMAALFYIRFPSHRRYTYNMFYGPVKPESWSKYFWAPFVGYHLFHLWGTILSHTFLTIMYFEMSSFWINRIRQLHKSYISSSKLIYRSSVRSKK